MDERGRAGKNKQGGKKENEEFAGESTDQKYKWMFLNAGLIVGWV